MTELATLFHIIILGA